MLKCEQELYIVINKNILVYMHNYPCPKSYILQIWPEKLCTV